MRPLGCQPSAVTGGVARLNCKCHVFSMFQRYDRLDVVGSRTYTENRRRLSFESHMTRIPRALLAAAALATISPSIVALRAQSDARERAMYVSVVNDAGDPVEGLGPDAFIVREDGVRREVLHVSRAT